MFVRCLFIVVTAGLFLSASPSQPAMAPRPDKLRLLPNITLTDIEGKKLTLNQLKGKFIVMDFWATWCRPCIEEINATRALQKEMGDKDISWVFVSLDVDADNWRQSVEQHRMEGTHIYVDEARRDSIKNAFGFHAIPYYVWFNKKGEVVLEDAPRPSEHGVKHKLELCLKKDAKE